MTEKEKQMYKILINISASDAPIVFKGALIKNLVLAEYGYNEIKRETKDIDCNWIDTPPSMNVLVDTIAKSLGDLQNEYYATIEREYGEKKSAGINIIKKSTNEEIVLMDISMKPVIGSKIYYYGEMSIKGVLANEILADKISVLSSNHIFRRTKDIIDVYALAHCVNIQSGEIFDIYDKTKRTLQSFGAFLNRKSELEHAYKTLKGVEGKPSFAVIYSYLHKFLIPFIEKDYNSKIWDNKNELWQDSL